MKKLIIVPIFALSTAQAIERQLILQPESLDATIPAKIAQEVAAIEQELLTVKHELISSMEQSLSLETIWRNRSQAAVRYKTILARINQLPEHLTSISTTQICCEVLTELDRLDSFVYSIIKRIKMMHLNRTVGEIYQSLSVHHELETFFNLNKVSSETNDRLGIEVSYIKNRAVRSAHTFLERVRSLLWSLSQNNELTMYDLHDECTRLLKNYVVPLETIAPENNDIRQVLDEITKLTQQINIKIGNLFDAKVKELCKGDEELLLTGHQTLYTFVLDLLYGKATTLSDDQISDFISKELEARQLIPQSRLYLKHYPALASLINGDQENDPSIAAPN